ncbi:MAG: depupylase/deamidase Dop [Ilumatobacteraceae bacterium]|nr:proteasome accessory factor PafA2 [Actinomycetota bacterium]NCX17704.1 proteasome accessory factor PafA2 [Acidimicrobiia bacterium]NCX60271.1 proteasome accessory factor PafA2 [Actinomycetota bacterium]NCX78316.1 proteasome accessory factor PafA2 [Actinomycetota bacterium]NCZ88563.1 proteasome accessory factor PafA2 [Actinomycetota bacterium]
MSIAKVCGIETEYGIVVRDAELNAVTASSMLINAFLGRSETRTAWDFFDEQPGNDARGLLLGEILAPEVETHLVNTVLTNGARYYVDHAHPECSTPECRTASEVVLYDRAAEEVMRLSMQRAQPLLNGGEIVVYKNNSDGKGNSYGCHENYLVDRAVPFGRLVTQITPHFISRQVFAGAGKVGCESPGAVPGDIPYQLSQRADFFEEEVGLETTLKRPIVNTRDEPHCDAAKYRRLHVIVGDANMSEVATFLKVGTTAIVLAMIEDDAVGDDLVLAHPVTAIRQVSNDPTLRAAVAMANGKRMTALDIQWQLLERARSWADRHGLEAVSVDDGKRILEEWEAVLDGLSTNPESMASVVDWVAKKRLVDGMAARHRLTPTDARLKAIDLQYSDLRREKSLALRCGLRTMVDAAAAQHAVDAPPESTRAWFRGSCLAKFPRDIVAANWDSIVFDVGRDPLRRVPMMEPLRGTRALTGDLIDSCDTAAELIAKLGATTGADQPHT